MVEYSNEFEQSNIKEYETDKKMWILWQDIRAKKRYAEILFRGMSGRGKTSYSNTISALQDWGEMLK